MCSTAVVVLCGWCSNMRHDSTIHMMSHTWLLLHTRVTHDWHLIVQPFSTTAAGMPFITHTWLLHTTVIHDSHMIVQPFNTRYLSAHETWLYMRHDSHVIVQPFNTTWHGYYLILPHDSRATWYSHTTHVRYHSHSIWILQACRLLLTHDYYILESHMTRTW